MNWFESLILGLLQGLTEYLPISSSGHLTIASSLFGIEGEQNLAFTILVHVATVLSTLVILWKEIVWIFKDLFAKQQWNSYSNLNYGTKYAINIVASMIPMNQVLHLKSLLQRHVWKRMCCRQAITFIALVIAW